MIIGKETQAGKQVELYQNVNGVVQKVLGFDTITGKPLGLNGVSLTSSQRTGPYTLSNGASQDVVHNLDCNLTEIAVYILESDIFLTQDQQSVYTIVEKTGSEQNAITVTNNSGGSKTFEVYIVGFNIDKLLGRQKARVVTSDATQTTLATIAIPTNEAMALDVLVGVRKDGTTANLYHLRGMAENNAGSAAIRISEKTMDEDDASWDVTLDASAGNVRVRVTGAAATSLEWYTVIQKTYF